MEQIRYIAVRPNGSICGPIGEKEHEVKEMMEYGFRKGGGIGGWPEIEKLGYAVRMAKITIIDDS